MQSMLGSQKSRDSGPSAPCALWPVDLKLTHLDWNPEATLIHFQGHYLTICDLDYNILQGEIQNIPKTKAVVDIGESCLVEDLTSARWFRGRVQKRKDGVFDVFLIDHGNVLSVDIAHISSCSNDFFILPPKIVCGFLSNVLLLQSSSHSAVEEYFSSLIGRNVTGYVQALLPHKVLLLEASDINNDLVRHGFGRHVDTDTFLLLVEMLTEVPLKQNTEPVPDLLIEKPRGQEFCFKPSGLQGYENILSLCGPRFSCGTHAKVRITAAVNPGLFYCQMVSMETDLWEMSKKLAAIGEYRTKEHNHKTPENLGLLCLVKGKDGKWYRGFVQYLPVNSQVQVLFVDYGFFESVKVENVHRLPSDLYSTPIMAFPCSLSSLTDQDKVLKTEQLSFLKAGLLGRVLDVEIRSFYEEQHLYSVTIFGAQDNHVKEPEPIQKPLSVKAKSAFEAEELLLQGSYLYYETIMGDALGKTLEVEEVQVDSVFVGYVEHVQNPNHFWIRTQKRNEEFEEMMSKMADHFNQVKLDEDVLLNPEFGALCCALYEEDMHFYRGVVTDILEHGAEVLFIDFGNVEKVPHMLIKNIPETFANKSAFAICCTLNVCPSDDMWTNAASDFFRQVVSNKALLVHVVQMRRNKFVVDLFETGSDNSGSIAELLISFKQAECIRIQPVVQNYTEVTEKTRRPQCSVAADISGNTERSDIFKEEENTCNNEMKKAQAPASFKALSIKLGCEFAVRCSYISSPSDFWCQPLDTTPALEELMDKIQQYYSTHTVPLQSGDSCCVAKSPQDGRWNRGIVTAKQNGHAIVMLVDYGCTIDVSETNLQAILPEYVHLEGQAFRCSLYNPIEPADSNNDGGWSPEVCNLLKDFVLISIGSLKCNVVSQLNVKNKGLCNVVDLYNTQTQQSVQTTLIEQGLARGAAMSTKQQLTVFPESFVYSSHDLSPGNEEHVYVTHVSSQWEVYFHVERNTEIIDKLQKKITEESEKITKARMNPVMRKLCLAKYLDGKWYRGLAHPVQSPLHLSVFFVDYGNTNISEKNNVLFIPRDSEDLLYTPMQAVRCSLSSVSKDERYADVKEWLDGAVLNKLVRAVIVGKCDDGSFDIELFDGEVNINEKVKELILSLSCKPKPAVHFDISSTKTKCQTRYRRNTKTSVRCRSLPNGQSSNSTTSHARSLSKNKENTKRNFHGRAQNKTTNVKQQNEDNAKNYTFKKNSQVKQQGKYQQVKSKQPQQSKETENLQFLCLPDKNVSVGFKVKCFVSHIDSLNSFFLQLSEDEPAILQMGKDLNSSTLWDSVKTATSLRVNDVVLAEYEEDGALYRAVVKNNEDGSHFRVEFVDYGNSAVIGKAKIFAIPKEYLSQPRFSIPCLLMDTSMFKNTASFTDAVMEKPLEVHFVRQHGTHWAVNMKMLDRKVGLDEAAVESNPVTEKEEESSTGLSETEEEERPCEQSGCEVCKNETSKSERMTPTHEVENLMPKPPNVTLLTRLKVKTCRHQRRRTPVRNKSDSKKNLNQTRTCSVKARGDCADAFIPPTIQPKDMENGTILSVESSGSLYVRLTRTSDFLSALESCIAYNLHKCKMVVGEDIKQGLKCLVEVQADNKWRRAVIRHINENKCEVFLVDHGVSEEIPSGSIRQQLSTFTKVPNLAVLCKMNSLGFSEGEDAQKLWCETLKPLIGKEVRVLFVCHSAADDLWMIEIVMNELFLIRQIETSPLQKILSRADTQNEGPDEEPILDTSPPQQLIFAPIDADKVYSGFAAAVTTPFEFCVVLEDLLLLMNKVSIMLDNLPGQMSPLPKDHLVAGSCCLLKSDSRNKWCRAEIAHADTTVVLNLVDYGHCECIPYDDCSKLKRLPVEMTSLPKVTYPCTLRGVKPAGVDGQWTDEAAVFFQQCLYQKNLQIFFRESVSNTQWKVDILADGVHVAKELVDAGHGNYVDVMLGLRFQEQRPCKAPPRSPDSEDCGQEDEDPAEVEALDEAEEETSHRSSQCFLM